MKTALIVPTLNAGPLWPEWLAALQLQTQRCDMELVIDSASTDHTAAQALACGLKVHGIERRDFNHGGTRQLGLELTAGAEVVVLMTQDAILEGSGSLAALLNAFEDPTVGAAYGRQLPHRNAKPLGAHARLYNYPPVSHKRALADKDQYGLKTAFISNSFAAYRRSALDEVGGFPRHVIFGEDTFAASHMLLKGWQIAYCAEAMVRHSHDYTASEDFKRYFDIGVLHSREAWIQRTFGKAEGEGLRFVKSELRYLSSHAPQLIPQMALSTAAKLVGYKLGLKERLISPILKKSLSMHRFYWENPSNSSNLKK